MLLMDKLSHGYFVVFTLAKINNIIEINKKNLVVCPFLCTFVGMKRMKREATRMDVGAKVLICTHILPPPTSFLR